MHHRNLNCPILSILLLVLLAKQGFGQCLRCPDNANDAAIGASGPATLTLRNGVNVNVSGQTIGACEVLIIRAVVAYNAFGISGGIGAGFTGGQGRIILPNGTSVDVTPSDMDTTLVAPPPCGTTQVKSMNDVIYTPTPDDIAAGVATFTFQYSDGRFLLPNPHNCNLKLSFSLDQSVAIAGLPACSVTPATNSVGGGSSTGVFTATATGSGPFDYLWTGPNGFSASSQSITITNAQTKDAGIYTAVVRDQFGCVTTCSSTLRVTPEISGFMLIGSDLILSGVGGPSNGTYVVLTASDPTPASWTPVATNTFDANGQFSFTNAVDASAAQRYFRLQIP